MMNFWTASSLSHANACWICISTPNSLQVEGAKQGRGRRRRATAREPPNPCLVAYPGLVAE
eukprot:3480167-Pyramimonas_sp.AAC.2